MKAAAAAAIVVVALALSSTASAKSRASQPGPTRMQLASSTTTTSPTTSPTTTTPTPQTLRLAPPRALDIASGRIALRAYAAYLQELVKNVSLAQAGDTAMIASVTSASDGCSSALVPLMQSNDQDKDAVQRTLTALGEEIGDDLALHFDSAALGPLVELTQSVEHLHWTRGARNAQVIRRYINTQTNALLLTPSALCQDAFLAVETPGTISQPTRTFIKRYNRLANQANNRLTDFLVLLRTYATYSELKLVSRITNLADTLDRIAKADQIVNAQAVTSSLETS